MITIEKLKEVYKKKGYIWENGINIIGIRTTLQVPDMFNDVMFCVYIQPAMPIELSKLDQQKWLNSNHFVGADGEKLTEDGNFGPNSNHALATYKSIVGKETLKTWTITTDPGTYWLNNPLSNLGTAILKPGQWVNCWSIGTHKKPDHRALVQTGKLTVYRDNNKNNIAEVSPTTEAGYFGINLHGASRNGTTLKIDRFSAGCQVFNNWTNKEEFIDICEKFKKERSNKFTYTLICESDLV